LSSPAEEASLRTIEKRRRHLDALVGLYPVKLLLVTRPVVNKAFIEPPTSLDGGMPTNNVVFVFLQRFNKRFWN